MFSVISVVKNLAVFTCVFIIRQICLIRSSGTLPIRVLVPRPLRIEGKGLPFPRPRIGSSLDPEKGSAGSLEGRSPERVVAYLAVREFGYLNLGIGICLHPEISWKFRVL